MEFSDTRTLGILYQWYASSDGIALKLQRFGFAKRIKKYEDNPEKLNKYLAKCENSIKEYLNDELEKMKKAKDFSDMVEFYKPDDSVFESPFEDFQ